MGCCSLRVEHINLYDEKDGKEFVVEFDFLGKDSIRYLNSVPVEKRVSAKKKKTELGDYVLFCIKKEKKKINKLTAIDLTCDPTTHTHFPVSQV